VRFDLRLEIADLPGCCWPAAGVEQPAFELCCAVARHLSGLALHRAVDVHYRLRHYAYLGVRLKPSALIVFLPMRHPQQMVLENLSVTGTRSVADHAGALYGAFVPAGGATSTKRRPSHLIGPAHLGKVADVIVVFLAYLAVTNTNIQSWKTQVAAALEECVLSGDSR